MKNQYYHINSEKVKVHTISVNVSYFDKINVNWNSRVIVSVFIYEFLYGIF